ncbi:MAG: DUF2254 domain-containing protein [Hyphomicrobiales bacterium]|nr:DUF2254 domain-containing protein [Hyphomicrobiales bacterium]
MVYRRASQDVSVGQKIRRLIETAHRGFIEFLKLPTIVIIGFLILAATTFVLDNARIPGDGQASDSVPEGFFRDAQAARDFLGVIAAGIITVTSITLSVLLVAVQQGASALTSLVFDQFLRRRSNQVYFGFFIGLALYALIVLASTSASRHPIYGLATAGVMTVVALYMLILLIYTSINQMRPVVIVTAIHDHTLLARERQLALLQRTRRTATFEAGSRTQVIADNSGFMTNLQVNVIAAAAPASEIEVIILVTVGDYVAFGTPIAEIRILDSKIDVSALKCAVRNAVELEEQRDLDADPAYGVDELVTIGWTSISTAKSNPDPGLLTIWALQDLLSRWLAHDPAFSKRSEADASSVVPIVYNDQLPEQLLRGFESLAVVASESMQHQCLAEIYLAFARLFHRLPPFLRRQAGDLIQRSLSGLGDHILTSRLEASLTALIDALGSDDERCARAVETARTRLGHSIGTLNSRSTRATAGERVS